MVGTTRRLVPTGHSDRRLGRSATRVNGTMNPAQVHVRLYMSRWCSDLELDSLGDAQSIEAGQRVGDVVGSPQVIGQPHSRVQHWLELSDQVDRKASQDAKIAIVQTSWHKADHQCQC